MDVYRRSRASSVADAADPVLREPTDTDLPALMVLLRAGVETYRDFLPAGYAPVDSDPFYDAGNWRERLATDGAWARVVDDDDGVAAFVFFHDGEGEYAFFSTLWVAERLKGRGIGRSLLATATEEMRRRGYPAATLWVARGHTRAITTYERAGWRATGRDRIYEYDGTPLIQYRLEL